MWNELQDNAQFQNQKMIKWQVDCNECGNRCKKTHNLKIHKWSDVKSIAINVEWNAGQCTILKSENDKMASQLQWFWKRCRKTHNSKIHKWSDGKSIALNEERGAGRCTLWKFTNDRMSSWLLKMWNEMQDNAQF